MAQQRTWNHSERKRGGCCFTCRWMSFLWPSSLSSSLPLSLPSSSSLSLSLSLSPSCFWHFVLAWRLVWPNKVTANPLSFSCVCFLRRLHSPPSIMSTTWGGKGTTTRQPCPRSDGSQFRGLRGSTCQFFHVCDEVGRLRELSNLDWGRWGLGSPRTQTDARSCVLKTHQYEACCLIDQGDASQHEETQRQHFHDRHMYKGCGCRPDVAENGGGSPKSVS